MGQFESTVSGLPGHNAAMRCGSTVIAMLVMNPLRPSVNLLGWGNRDGCHSVAICASRVVVDRSSDQTHERPQEMEQHTITPDALYILLVSNQDVPVFDVACLSTC